VKAAIPLGTGLLVLQGIVKLLEDIAVAFNLNYYTPEPQDDAKGEPL
jgi:TRAP-type mannitol/chloroaromatic compound transport system permease small subunit